MVPGSEETAVSTLADPVSFCQKCRLAPPEFSGTRKLKFPESSRFHFWQNRPLNRLVALGVPAFDTSREVSKEPISTLPAAKLAGPGQSRKQPENSTFRLFPDFPDIQGALAYTSDRTGRECQEPGQQGWPGWLGWPGSRVPGSWIQGPGLLDPGSRAPGSRVPSSWIQGPRLLDPGS